jgi:hypothetical protein
MVVGGALYKKDGQLKSSSLHPQNSRFGINMLHA